MEKSTHSPEYRILRSGLLDARHAAGLSQRDLAARLKVTHSWVAKVESGERRIDLVETYWYLSACGDAPLASLTNLMERFPRRLTARSPKRGRR
jgi:transcriptional regulator with XRE-family HTH domain